MLDNGIWGMIFLGESTSESSADGFLTAVGKRDTRAMMSVNTKFQVALLTIQAWVQPGQVGNGLEIFFSGFILMFEAAIVAFGAGTAEVVIVA